MSCLEKEKTRSDVAASERAEEQRKPTRDFSVSSVDFTMSGKGMQSFMADALCKMTGQTRMEGF